MGTLDEAVKRLNYWSARNHLTMLGAVTGDIRTVLDALLEARTENESLRALRTRWLEVTGALSFVSAVEAEARSYHDSACGYQRERDEALAVIERAKAWAEETYDPLAHEGSDSSQVLEILNAVPADVLRERDAERWDEGFAEGQLDGSLGRAEPNPYRETKEQD